MAEISNMQKDLPHAWQDESVERRHSLPYLQGTQQVLTHFKPLPTDVILASYPKTGTTWLKAILYSIVNRTTPSLLPSNHPHELVPSLEGQVYKPGSDYLETMTGKRRIFSTHLPYKIFSDHSHTIDSSECKIVYITRNPKDTVVSFWHYVKKSGLQEAASWPLEMAVNSLLFKGIASYGPYYDHVLEYKQESSVRPDKFFFTTYEELTSNTKGEVKRLAEFLGCPFDKDGEEDQILEEIVKNCSIGTLKSHGVNKSDDCPSWLGVPYNAYFRQGGVGDHKNYLTPEMIERIDAITKEKFHGSGFMFGI